MNKKPRITVDNLSATLRQTGNEDEAYLVDLILRQNRIYLDYQKTSLIYHVWSALFTLGFGILMGVTLR